MQLLQRALGILLAIVILILLPVWEKKQQTERYQREWKEVLLQRFCEEICMLGVCSAESYLRYSEALQQGEKAYCLQIAEYRKEESVDGTSYWYSVVWEEIETKLFGQGRYSFAAEAAVQLLAVAQDGKKLFCGGCITSVYKCQ